MLDHPSPQLSTPAVQGSLFPLGCPFTRAILELLPLASVCPRHLWVLCEYVLPDKLS